MKTYILSLLVLIIALFASCAKKEASSKCIKSGIITDEAVFYVLADPGCGPITLSEVKDSNGNKQTIESRYNTITIVDYNVDAIPCRSTSNLGKRAVAHIICDGSSYSYIANCQSRTFTGTFTTRCEDDCIKIQLK